MITAAVTGAAAIAALIAAGINAGYNAATATNQINASIPQDTRAAFVDDEAEQACDDEVGAE